MPAKRASALTLTLRTSPTQCCAITGRSPAPRRKCATSGCSTALPAGRSASISAASSARCASRTTGSRTARRTPAWIRLGRANGSSNRSTAFLPSRSTGSITATRSRARCSASASRAIPPVRTSFTPTTPSRPARPWSAWIPAITIRPRALRRSSRPTSCSARRS